MLAYGALNAQRDVENTRKNDGIKIREASGQLNSKVRLGRQDWQEGQGCILTGRDWRQTDTNDK